MKLCINADDYLIHERIDSGVRDAIVAGAVTSVSVMGDAQYGSSLDWFHRSSASVGLHLSLTSGGNETLPQFSGPADIVKAGIQGQLPQALVKKELAGQYSRFVADYGKPPSHLDCHEHVHAWPVIRRVVLDLAMQNNIPYVRIPRDCSPDFSLKKLLLSAAFPVRKGELAFFGINLMGSAFTWKNIQRQLEYLDNKRITRALWMVHVGYRGPEFLAGRRDYAHREAEQAVLLQHIGRIREYAELVPMEKLFETEQNSASGQISAG